MNGSPAGRYELVTIAASAGGIKAIEAVLAGLPVDFPLPIVIVQHRSGDDPNLLARVLSRHTDLAVKTAEDGEPVQPGVVYVAPARLHLQLAPGRRLQLTDGRRIRHTSSSANPLFESAAAELGPRVIAVVLTGYDRDGTDGVQAVRKAGGTVIAQDEATSEVFGMPKSAIETGAVSLVLPLQAIAGALMERASAIA